MSLNSYRLAVRGAIRGLWTGVLDINQFFDQLSTAIRVQFPFAYAEGAAECDILPADFSPDELLDIQRLVVKETGFVFTLGLTIEENDKASGAKLGKHFNRVRLWTNRYLEAQNAGKIKACADAKLLWSLHSKVPCISALKLDGKVKRASFWQNRVLPGDPRLECVHSAKGIGVCACSLTRTSQPLSKGPLPRIP